MSNALCAFFNLVITCSTARQAVMDRMEQMERSMEELRVENQRSINIGPEMDQEIDTNVHQ